MISKYEKQMKKKPSEKTNLKFMEEKVELSLGIWKIVSTINEIEVLVGYKNESFDQETQISIGSLDSLKHIN